MTDPDDAARSRSNGPAAWQEAVITGITPLTAMIKSFVLKPKIWQPFLAGQHLDLRLTAPDGYQAQRSYSLASAPETKGSYELAIDLLDEGEVSPFFHDIALAGDAIEIRGPFGGHFVWTTKSGPALLIGGGSGIVPLLCMVRHRAAQRAEVPLSLLYGARGAADAAFGAELIRLAAASPGLLLSFAFSREKAIRPEDFSGRIDRDVLAAMLDRSSVSPDTVFVCGSNRFVETVTAHLVDLGQPAAAIRTERYGGA